MARASKGSVSQSVDNGSIKLRWRWGGKRYSLGTGIAPGDKIGQIKIAELSKVISRDLEYGEFEGDVSKYRAILKPDAVKVREPKPEPQTHRLSILWDQYVDSRSAGVSPTTIDKDYGRVSRMLSKLPTDRLEDAVRVRDWVIKHYSPNSAKRVLVQLSACCKWSVTSGLIPSNPFQGMAAQVAIPKSERVGDEIDPFTPDERAAIIAGFENSQYYRYYAPLVQFLFLTGCRPGEALALRWGHIEPGAIRFQDAAVSTRANQVKSGLKTQKNRKFPVNGQLKKFLETIPQVNGLVFPAPEGGIINLGNFASRAWSDTLKVSGVRHRSPYQTRHTFITEALRRGMSVQDVAKLVGNSPQVIYAHYAGASRDLVVPEF